MDGAGCRTKSIRGAAPVPKSKGGRLKIGTQNRDKWIKVRLSETELAAIKKAAAESGRTVSEFARARLLQHDRTEPKAGLIRLAKGNAGEKRNVKISVRLTEEERAWINERAAWMGCTSTELIRKLMFSNEDIAPVVIDTEALRQTYLELHRQGVNLNQLMTYLNTYKANADTRGITETLSKVYASLDKMDEVIDSVKKKTETL
jgi:uncharacterized protein (DUF1778 family)